MFIFSFCTVFTYSFVVVYASAYSMDPEFLLRWRYGMFLFLQLTHHFFSFLYIFCVCVFSFSISSSFYFIRRCFFLVLTYGDFFCSSFTIVVYCSFNFTFIVINKWLGSSFQCVDCSL